jgi:hypothetical protein
VVRYLISTAVLLNTGKALDHTHYQGRAAELATHLKAIAVAFNVAEAEIKNIVNSVVDKIKKGLTNV